MRRSFSTSGLAADEQLISLLREHGPASAKRFYGLQFSLEDLLGRSVDLVTEKALPEEFRRIIEADAIRISEAHPEMATSTWMWI
jgi:hypothetical protein